MSVPSTPPCLHPLSSAHSIQPTNHTHAVLHPSLSILPSWLWHEVKRQAPPWRKYSRAAFPSRLSSSVRLLSSHGFIKACALCHVSHKLMPDWKMSENPPASCIYLCLYVFVWNITSKCLMHTNHEVVMVMCEEVPVSTLALVWECKWSLESYSEKRSQYHHSFGNLMGFHLMQFYGMGMFWVSQVFKTSTARTRTESLTNCCVHAPEYLLSWRLHDSKYRHLR